MKINQIPSTLFKTRLGTKVRAKARERGFWAFAVRTIVVNAEGNGAEGGVCVRGDREHK